jgi:AraC-like DNA-binding protein
MNSQNLSAVATHPAPRALAPQPSRHPEVLRPIRLRRYLSVAGATARQVDEEILARTFIDATRLDDPDYFVSTSCYLTAVSNLIRFTGDRGIGFDAGLASDFRDSGIAGYASWSGPNQRENLERLWNRYGRFFGLMTTICLTPTGTGTIEMTIDAPDVSPPLYRFLVEELIGIFLKVGTDMNGCNPEIVRVELVYDAPPHHHRYRQLLGCPVTFNQGRSCITFTRAWLEQPLHSSDQELCEICSEKLEQLERRIGHRGKTSTTVLNLLYRDSSHLPHLDRVARELRTTPRTLSRQLMNEGTSFSRLMDEVRSQMAIAIVINGNTPAKKIADRLGFDDVNALRRAFKRWTGQSISDYRASRSG